MTLKQFFQLAGGIAVGLIFYHTPFPFFIKYPLIFISVLGGILLAFVPLNGRPFSQWVMAFFKAIYSPTQFYWHPIQVENTPPVSPPNLGGDQSGGITKETSPLDKLESQLFSKFSDLFDTISSFSHRPAAKTPTILSEEVVTPPVAVPQEEPRPNPPRPSSPLETAATAAPPPPQINPFAAAMPLTPTLSHSPLPTARVPSPADGGPLPPEQPNILAGMVHDDRQIATEGVILEIAEKATGLPVRALRSNKLGQFQIATPLPNGEYIITAEKEGLVFDPLLIVTTGQLIPPILVAARPIT